MVAKEVSEDKGETVLAAVVVMGIASGFWSDVGRVSGSFQVDLVVQVSGSLARLLLASRVVFSRTYVHTAIRSVWVWLVWGSVRLGTCAFVDLHSNISRVVWIVATRPHSLSEQPVLPELLADSEESGVVVWRWGLVQFQWLVRGS
jgi:hypothetical protein